MLEKMRKTVTIALTLVALAVAALTLMWRFAPPKTIERIARESGPAKVLLCGYPVRVSGDAMAPIFRHGERVMLSKCVENRENLAIGTVILYEQAERRRLSVIRERLTADDGGILYRVSQEAHQKEIGETRPDDILAIDES